MTDEQAMWQVQMGDDPAAFAVLVERWEAPIRSLCTRMTGDPHRGEDLAQETFARVFTRRRQFEQSSRFSTWLWRIALNLCYDELRRTHRRRDSVGDLEEEHTEQLPAPEAGPDEQLAQKETASQVRAALQKLPEHYRAVLALRHYEGLKFREIAELLEIPEGTVKSRMAEALTLMSRLLRETEIGGQGANRQFLAR